MTSIASATAWKGHPSTPWTVFAFWDKPTEIAISVAPPPGASVGLNTTLRATDIASARLRSISFNMSFEGPRRRIVHAFGVVHFVKKVKYLRQRAQEKVISSCTCECGNPEIGDKERPTRHLASQCGIVHRLCRRQLLSSLLLDSQWCHRQPAQFCCCLISEHGG